jgi:hypothetical protein
MPKNTRACSSAGPLSVEVEPTPPLPVPDCCGIGTGSDALKVWQPSMDTVNGAMPVASRIVRSAAMNASVASCRSVKYRDKDICSGISMTWSAAGNN